MFNYRRWKKKPSRKVQIWGRIDGKYRGIKPERSSMRAIRRQIQVTGFCLSHIHSVYEKLEVFGLQRVW
jgi:hypothetical protein